MVICTVWKVSKYGIFSGPYFLEYGKYGPEKTPYLDNFDAVLKFKKIFTWQDPSGVVIIGYAVASITFWYQAWFWGDYAVEIPKPINFCYDLVETMCHVNAKCKEISSDFHYFEKLN